MWAVTVKWLRKYVVHVLIKKTLQNPKIFPCLWWNGCELYIYHIFLNVILYIFLQKVVPIVLSVLDVYRAYCMKSFDVISE